MDAPAKTGHQPEVSDYLAAERTLLAWIRTGLALMGFGFVVARFGLFLQQLQILQHAPAIQPYGLSLWFGTALIAAGVLVNLLSGWSHVQLVRTFNRQQGHQPYSTALAVFTCLFLALVGLAMAIYLVTVRGSANTQSQNSKEASMAQAAPASGRGMIDMPSNHSVDQTVEKLKEMLRTKLLIFGSPKAGTPLMQAAPSVAIDLPLKLLVWEDHQGKVWISYNSPEYLKERHGLRQDLLQNVAVAGVLATKAAE